MADLTIQLNPGACSDTCGLCGHKAIQAAGPRLCLGEGPDTVCRDCARQHAPALVALLDLARVAERVGRVGRHTLSPPLEAMLRLMGAAESYTQTTAARACQAVPS